MSNATIPCYTLVPKHQQLIVLKTSDTVQFALETFQERHFRSCPVQDESGAIAVSDVDSKFAPLRSLNDD